MKLRDSKILFCPKIICAALLFVLPACVGFDFAPTSSGKASSSVCAVQKKQPAIERISLPSEYDQCMKNVSYELQTFGEDVEPGKESIPLPDGSFLLSLRFNTASQLAADPGADLNYSQYRYFIKGLNGQAAVGEAVQNLEDAQYGAKQACLEAGANL